MALLAEVADTTFRVEITPEGDVLIDGNRHSIDICNSGGPGICSVLIDNKSYDILVEKSGNEYLILINGKLYRVHLQDARVNLCHQEQGLASDRIEIAAPLCGLVTRTLVSAAEHVQAGEVLLILESMKMEMELKSPISGIVEDIYVNAGDVVKQHDILAIVRRVEEEL